MNNTEASSGVNLSPGQKPMTPTWIASSFDGYVCGQQSNGRASPQVIAGLVTSYIR